MRLFFRLMPVIVLALTFAACQSRQKEDPIVAAVLQNDVAEIEAWLAAGGDPDFKSQSGDPLIYLATGPKGGEAAVRALVAAGADVDAASPEGRTPLHNAASWCDVDLVIALLSAGADRSLPGKNGENVVDAVCKAPADKRAQTLQILDQD